jgi:hypothetical protein
MRTRRLTREQAVAWVTATTRCRTRKFAVKTVDEALAGSTPYGMFYRNGFWRIPDHRPVRPRARKVQQ